MIIPSMPYIKTRTVEYTHRTRSGLPARILCTDFRGSLRPVLAAVQHRDASESLVSLQANLKETDDTDSERDLFERSHWDDVAVDTPIWVCAYKGCPTKWTPRHFAKYENGKVFAWNDGWTRHAGEVVTPVEWAYATLENPNKPSESTT